MCSKVAKIFSLLLECEPLDTPSNGSLKYSNGMTYRSVATFSCDSGFLLDGNLERTCLEDNSWNGTNPTCKIISMYLIEDFKAAFRYF